MKKLRIYLFAPLMLALLAFTGLFFIAGCAKSEGGKTTESSSDNKLVPVKTALVAQKNMALPIHSSGFLTTTAEQRLAFKIGGIVKKIYVDEGDFVKAGQLLAVLDKTEIDAQLRQAQEGLGKAERDLNRVLALYKDSSATLELVQNATTGRDVAKESAKIAAFNQQYAEIRATRPGKIIKKLINEGEITGPGTPAFVLFETGNNDWVVKINTSDRDWARINLGMPAKVHMDAYPDQEFTGKVSELAPAADPNSGLYPIEIRIAPQGKRFAPGLFASVDIQPQQARKYTLIPTEAIMEGDGQEAFVFAVNADGNSVRKIPVQIAFIQDEQVVIAGGLEGIQAVVTAGAPYLTEKSKVVVQNQQ